MERRGEGRKERAGWGGLGWIDWGGESHLQRSHPNPNPHPNPTVAYTHLHELIDKPSDVPHSVVTHRTAPTTGATSSVSTPLQERVRGGQRPQEGVGEARPCAPVGAISDVDLHRRAW